MASEYFSNPTRGRLSWGALGGEIKDFVFQHPQSQYRLIIGSDSRIKKKKGKPGAEIVTAVVIHRKGQGGRYFWRKKYVANVYSLKEKLYLETLASLEVAQKLLTILKEDLNGHFETLEIHIDVGQKGPSRDTIKELVGMVVGNGFTPKTKPESYGAFVVADKYT